MLACSTCLSWLTCTTLTTFAYIVAMNRIILKIDIVIFVILGDFRIFRTFGLDIFNGDKFPFRIKGKIKSKLDMIYNILFGYIR